jgi:hypothetical protein
MLISEEYIAENSPAFLTKITLISLHPVMRQAR